MKRKIFSVGLALVLLCSFGLVTAAPVGAGAGTTYTRAGSTISVISQHLCELGGETQGAFNAEPKTIVLDAAAFNAQTNPVTIEGEVSVLALGDGWVDTAYIEIGLRPEATKNARNAGVYLIALNGADGTQVHLQDYTGGGRLGGVIPIPKNSDFSYEITLTPSGDIGGTATLEVWVGGVSQGTVSGFAYGYASDWQERIEPLGDVVEDFSNAHLFYSIIADRRGVADQTYSAAVGAITITSTDLYSNKLDKDWYRTGETVYVTVNNPLANDPNRTDGVEVEAISDSDLFGTAVTLAETGTNTGVFEGSFLLVEPPSPPEPPPQAVMVEDGDLITVTYLGATATATVDDIPPVISNLSPADGQIVPTATPTISAALADVGSGIDTATGVMAIDGTPVLAAVTAADISYTPADVLAEGTHTVTVDVDDVAGNAATPVSWSFTVDTDKPTVTVALSPDPPYTTTGNITFALTFSEPMDTSVMPTVTFGLSNPFTTHPVSSLWWSTENSWIGQYEISAWKTDWDGLQTLSISGAKDLAGNEMLPDTSFTFVIDLNAPDAPYDMLLFVNQNSPGTADSVVGFDYAVEPNAVVEVWSDAGAQNLIGSDNATGVGSFPAIEIGDNLYGEVWVTAQDAVGHRSAATRLENDIIYPLITINLVFTPTNIPFQTIAGTFTEANPDTITLTVNGVSQIPISIVDSSWSVSATLVEGDNTILATITDVAGNSATAEAYIYLDITPPGGYIDIPEFINAANVLNVPVIIGSDEDGTYNYSISGVVGSGSIEAGVPVEFEVDLSALLDGPIFAQVLFVDGLGNISEPVWDYATKDIEVPAPPEVILTDPINAVNQYTVDLMGTGEAGARVVYSITDGIGGEVTGEGTVLGDDTIEIAGIDVSSLVDGTLTASVTQTDEAGNTSNPCTDTATKDTLLPTVVIASEAPDPTNTSPIVLTATFSENVTGFEKADITVGNGAVDRFATENAPVYMFTVVPDADGLVTVDIAAGVTQDAAGNPNEVARQFTILYDATAPAVTVTSPNGGESWLGGSTRNITWTATDANLGDTPITLDYSLNGGVNWDTIEANVANTGLYSWVVPNLGSSNCLIRVTAVDLAGNSGSDDSNSEFTITSDTIAPAVTVNSPNGGENWQGGSTQTITWTATDDKTPPGNLLVNLCYSPNGGTDWVDIAVIESSSGAYSWTVPEINSSQCLVAVEVSDTSGNVGFDVSDRVFTITTPEAPPEPTNTIELRVGWNLVSLMLIPDSSNITDVLEGIPVVSVWAYDASVEDPDERWSWYKPDAPGDLEEMVDGKGYWIEMSSPATLIIEGQELPDPPAALPAYSVVEGWNLIGFKSTTPRTADDYLLAIDGKYTIVRGYDGSYTDIAAGQNLDPGYGYWISMTEPGVIYP